MKPGTLATLDSVYAIYDSYSEALGTSDLTYSVSSGSACEIEPIGPAINALHFGDCSVKIEARGVSANISVHVEYLDSIFGDGYD